MIFICAFLPPESRLPSSREGIRQENFKEEEEMTIGT